jgi:ribosomal protein S7
MVQKNKKIKNTLINHLMLSGNKKTCETILLKSLKIIQKICKKSHKTILKLAIINSTSAFRLIELKPKKRKKKKNSKEIPIFISNNYERITWSLKFISQTIRKNTTSKSYNNLKQEIMYSSQNEGDSTKIKTDLHKQIITRKRLFLYFRW